MQKFIKIIIYYYFVLTFCHYNKQKAFSNVQDMAANVNDQLLQELNNAGISALQSEASEEEDKSR